MENLETLNAIVDEFEIKKATLDVFRLAELAEEGKRFRIGTKPEFSHVPDIVFEDANTTFCSIFSGDSSFSTQATSVGAKLKSDDEILSSDFGVDDAPVLLTSDNTEKCLDL